MLANRTEHKMNKKLIDEQIENEDDRLTFRVVIGNFRVSNLTTRHRFKEKLQLHCIFDDQAFKTEKQLVGGGDVAWKYQWKQDWHLECNDAFGVENEFVEAKLSNKYLIINCGCQHSHDSGGKETIGSCKVDLYTLAVGPVEHYLPLVDESGKMNGSLSFSVEMVQVCEITVQFLEIKVKNLQHSEDHSVNPYLKYAYSKDWPAIVNGKVKAFYSEVQMHTASPVFKDLPKLRFKTSLNELVRESIILHVTHKGKFHNTTLGSCSLLFRSLVDGGNTFKENDQISFKGPLSKKPGENAYIEGHLTFQHLPRFAQMKPLNLARKAIHTERGILDAVPLLSWIPKPRLPIHLSDSNVTLESQPKEPKQTLVRMRSSSFESSSSAYNIKDKDNTKEAKVPEGPLKKQESVHDLVDLSSPTPSRARSATTTQPSMFYNFDSFEVPFTKQEKIPPTTKAPPLVPFVKQPSFKILTDISKKPSTSSNPFAQQNTNPFTSSSTSNANKDPFADLDPFANFKK